MGIAVSCLLSPALKYRGLCATIVTSAANTTCLARVITSYEPALLYVNQLYVSQRLTAALCMSPVFAPETV